MINFEEDTGGALPSGPELEVVDSKTKATFPSLLGDKYKRAGAAPAEEP